MGKSFGEFVDIVKLQQLTDNLYATASIPSSIIDVNGKIITESGWQKICTDFHRKNPLTLKDCIESDLKVRKQNPDTPYTIYTCPRGLIDASVPIVIEGEKIGSIFVGQVFLEPPGPETEMLFRKQARKFGFNEEEYIEAFRAIPVFSEEKLHSAISFLYNLSIMISDLGIMRLREAEAAEQIRKSEKEYRNLFNNIYDVYYRTDKKGIVTLISPSIKYFTGYSPEDMIGKDLADFYLHREEREKFQSEITRNGHVQYFEAQIKTSDNSVKWASTNARMMIDEEGNFTGVEGIARDITELKRTEEEQLKKEKLQAAVETAGAVCHELNQPLQAILGHLELLEIEVDDRPYLEKINVIKKQVERMGKITRKLMGITRYETMDYLDRKIIDLGKSVNHE